MKLTKRSIAVIIIFMFLSDGTGCNFAPDRTVTIRVLSHTVPTEDSLFIAGDISEFGSWNPGKIALKQLSDSVWQGSFNLRQGTITVFKITRGSWRTEALDERGTQITARQTLQVVADTILILRFEKWMDRDGGISLLSENTLSSIHNEWRYHSGDDMRWSALQCDDSKWEIVNSRLESSELPLSGWNGTGWFRLHIDIDSTLWNKPVGLHIRQSGASEIYIDGTLLYTFGKLGRSRQEEQLDYDDVHPKVFSFTPGRHHVLAVRYSNYSSEYFYQMNATPGFRFRLNRYDSAFEGMRRDTIFQILITTILFTLASLHFVFYLFYPRFRENLFYAISTIGIGGIWYANNQMNFLVSQNRILAINILSTGSQIIAVFFGLLLTYWFRYEKIPLRASVYALFGCVILLWSTIRLNAEFYIAKDLYTFIAFAEMVFSLIRAKNKDKVGAYIISTGFIILTVSVFYEILAGNRWIPRIEGARDTYVLGALALGISMSIFLSRRFAKTHRELELQLKQVRELSERTLAQERQAREVEIERRLLEADNSRKTKELEEARALQLSMLPRVLPMIPNLDIAVYMKTAAEVGGDYYDFAVAPDGTLTIVLGDATGHGTKAGMMVAITKSLFDDYTHTQNIPDIFNKYTNSIKKLELHSLYMALLLVRIKDGKLVASSAGIPSPLIYRFISREVEELILKGMPLGSFQNFPYEQRETQLSIGDTVVLMSDGLSERFNGKKEGFGVTAVKELLSKIGNTSSQEIIHHLSAASESWASGEPQNDDIMMVVVKLKSI